MVQFCCLQVGLSTNTNTGKMIMSVIIYGLVCAYVTASAPEFWIDCGSPSYDCGVFDFEFARSDDSSCEEGMRVLCRSPQRHFEEPPTLANEISVMTYNVYEKCCGQVERTCRIPAIIVADYPQLDVIVFQEMFYGGCWKDDDASARDLLRQHGFPYFTKNVGSAEIEDPLNAGIFIASKHPIVKEQEYLFKANDWNIDQGVMYAKIIKSIGSKNQTYHVFGSHLRCCRGEAQETLRRAQAIEWNAFVKDMDIPVDEAVILAADFNMDFYRDKKHVMDMLEVLRAKVPPVVSEQYATWSARENDIILLEDWSPDESEYIDYVLLRHDYLQPIHALQTIVRPRSKQPMRICWEAAPNVTGYVCPDTSECLRTEVFSDLSDHYAVIGTILFGD